MRVQDLPEKVFEEGYLAHKKPPPPRTLQLAYAQGPMVVIGEVAAFYERGTPVTP